MSNYNQLKIVYSGGSQTAITLTNNYIDGGEYQNQNIVAVEVPEIVEFIGSYAFCDNNKLAYIKLNEGVTNIDGQAFQHGVYSAVTIPSTVLYIGVNAFNINDEQRMGYAGNLTINCLAVNPPILDDQEGIIFGNKNLLTIKVPDASVNDYKSAWSEYADVIEGGAQPEPEPASGLTTKDIAAAYMGTDSVAKIYLGSEEVWAAQGPDYLTFEVISGGTIVWSYSGAGTSLNKTIQYSKNGGEWTNITNTSSTEPPYIKVQAGDIVQFRGDNRAYAAASTIYSHFGDSTCWFKLKGNIMSLIDSTGFTTATTMDNTPSGYSGAYTFLGLFRWCTGLTDASDLLLPATLIRGQGAYRQLFQDCINLVTPPRVFPATSITGGYHYNATFKGCTSLTTAPEILLTDANGGSGCFQNMFQGCTSLTTVPDLLVTGITNNSSSFFNGMFQGCTSLTTAPDLLVTGITGTGSRFFDAMFSGCTNLNYIKCLLLAQDPNSVCIKWVDGVSPTGTFVKHPDKNWPWGVNGIPYDWNVEDAVI